MEDLDELEPELGCFCRPSVHNGQIVVKPEPRGLASARQEILSVARELAFDDDDTTDLLIAVGEALSNAYRHGTSDPNSDLIHISWQFANNVMTVVVKDDGPGCCLHESASDREKADLMCGRGIRLMRECVDGVHFEWNDGGKVVLTKRLRTKNLHDKSIGWDNNEESRLSRTMLDPMVNKQPNQGRKFDNPGQTSHKLKNVSDT